MIVHANASATWSIIIFDPESKKIGIAGASCSYNCYGIGEIIPGKGAVIVQAMSNNRARIKGLKMIIADYSPQEVINELRKPRFDPENQQYAVMTFQHINNPLTYTGKTTNAFNGALTGKGISVQGNTLSNENEINVIFEAVLKAQKASMAIEDVLMIALEAGSKAGGDSRCGEQKATSAFITIMRPSDDRKNPYLNLLVSGQQKGGTNAVELLRDKYDLWKRKAVP